MDDANKGSYFYGGVTNVGQNFNPETQQVHVRDWDHDGYYNWGIGPKPDTLPANAKEDCDDSDPSIGPYNSATFECTTICSFDNKPVIIDNSELWTENKHFNRNLVVQSPAVLTIKSKLFFSEGAKLIIERGGTVVLDEGILTTDCPGLWEGVEVWGDSYHDQYTAGVQGQLVVIGGTIENAICAVRLFRSVTDSMGEKTGLVDMDHCGGIVKSEGAKYLNNQVAIQFYPYSFTNHSFFKKDTFETNRTLLGNITPDYFIKMDDVTGITFKGCTFFNPNLTINVYNNGS
ncbi:MAG: hypothetical protein NTU44_00735 [Bacteroidetes bacterium]|nr:hypothetical protein [Bacteroidota bacterium]